MFAKPIEVAIGQDHNANPEDFEAHVVPIRVLIVEDDSSCARGLNRSLARKSIDVKVAKTMEQARQVLVGWDGLVDAVVLDLKLSDGRGEDLLPGIENMGKKLDLIHLSEVLHKTCPKATSHRVFLSPTSIVPTSLSVLLEWLVPKGAYFTLCQFATLFCLTNKESEILALLANGTAPKRIAMDGGFSIQAVYARLTRICAKTKCANYQEVLAKLFQFSCHPR